MTRPPPAGEPGFATVAVLALSSALALLAAALVALGSVAVLRSHAAAAADEAALAAAGRSREGSGPACAVAASVAAAVGARLVSCRLGGDLSDVAQVEVSLPGPGVLAAFGPARGLARAGPVGAAAGVAGRHGTSRSPTGERLPDRSVTP